MPSSASKKAQKVDAKDKPSEPVHKIVIRRLPAGFTREELLHQIEPLNKSCVSFWFRKPNTLMEPWSFTRAYLAFTDWSAAVEFKRKFNGYVFIDKQGNESAAIVELSVHQEVPESFPVDSAKKDRRVGTLEEKSDYKSFLNDFNSLVLHKVTNFDELIREVEEKEKRLKKGIVSETPLVKFLLQQAIEKERKRIARMEKHKPSTFQKSEDDNKKKNMSREDKRNSRKNLQFEVRFALRTKRNNEFKKSKFDDLKERKKPEKSAAVDEVREKRGPEKSKRVDDSKGPKQFDDSKSVKRFDEPTSSELTVNGVPKRKRTARKRSREYSEFGNVKPKLLSRNHKISDDQSLPELSKSKAKEPVTKSEEKSDFWEVPRYRAFSTEDPPENGKADKDEKRRRHAQRPERQIYRPPVRNRDKDKEKLARLSRDVET